VSAVLGEAIVSTDTYEVAATLDYIIPFNKKGTFADLNITSIPAGPYSGNKTITLPAGVSGSHVKAQVTVAGADGQYACIAIEFSLGYTKNGAFHHMKEVNSMKTTWTAGPSKRFAGKTLEYVKSLCGVDVQKEKAIGSGMARKQHKLSNLPDSFDARASWPECRSIAHVRDQANCGSCWAFGSTEAFTDRMCIKSNGTFTKELSAQDTTSCCDLFHCLSFGCNGGQPSAAWNWFVSTGAVSGGDYTDIGSGSSCWPYQLPVCSHHVNDPNIPNCTAEVSAPSCSSQCSEKGYATPYSADKVKAKTSFTVQGVEQIQTEIMTNGPVTGAFQVYGDFPAYKSGVYTHVTGDLLGGHAIKIFGWGVENGTPYWHVMNSVGI
jgi:cathepsin B